MNALNDKLNIKKTKSTVQSRKRYGRCFLSSGGKMMKKSTQVIIIKTNEQLENCVLSGIEVEYDVSVIIEFNDNVIKTAEHFYYLRENCQLVTCENYFRLVN